jgi:hypothetical protein
MQLHLLEPFEKFAFKFESFQLKFFFKKIDLRNHTEVTTNNNHDQESSMLNA